MTRSFNDFQSPQRGAYRLRLAPDEVRELRKYLSVIVSRVQAAMAGDPGVRAAKRLTIDLDGAPRVPGAQLVALVKLLRRNLGNGVLIELSGVKPTILGSLVAFGIPPDVAVIDSRGRPWTG